MPSISIHVAELGRYKDFSLVEYAVIVLWSKVCENFLTSVRNSVSDVNTILMARTYEVHRSLVHKTSRTPPSALVLLAQRRSRFAIMYSSVSHRRSRIHFIQLICPIPILNWGNTPKRE